MLGDEGIEWSGCFLSSYIERRTRAMSSSEKLMGVGRGPCIAYGPTVAVVATEGEGYTNARSCSDECDESVWGGVGGRRKSGASMIALPSRRLPGKSRSSSHICPVSQIIDRDMS